MSVNTKKSVLSKGRKQPPPRVAAPTIVQQTEIVIPEKQFLLENIPGIEPFLLPGLIPDLYDMYSQEGGPQELIRLVGIVDPRNPEDIIFQSKWQEVHKKTEQIELSILATLPEAIERDDIQCGKCRSRKIRAYATQKRSADEPPTIFATCTQCRFAWSFSAA